MTDATSIDITPSLRLPLSELHFQASRSGGPGGQHVNTSSTRVELWWDVTASTVLTAQQRTTLLARLASRLTEDGQLRIVSSETRSQTRNKDAAVERLRELLAEALRPVKPRRKTKPSRAVKERRLQGKRQRSERKRDRRHRGSDD
jgi:ribosome-associated protein